ncbi:hypothetical protein [Burkholderia metallica]
MADTIRYCDAMTRAPALWHDVENDQPIAPRCRADLVRRVRRGGGQGDLVYESQPSGRDEHATF